MSFQLSTDFIGPFQSKSVSPDFEPILQIVEVQQLKSNAANDPSAQGRERHRCEFTGASWGWSPLPCGHVCVCVQVDGHGWFCQPIVHVEHAAQPHVCHWSAQGQHGDSCPKV